MAPYRVLVVDDSAFMRKFICDLIQQDSQFTIVATAVNGQEAVEAVREWKPDAVTLDLEMPVMNGIEALQQIMKSDPTPVIMLSGISDDNTRETIKALQYGAFDFIRKPSGILSNDIQHACDALLEKLRIAVKTKRHQPALTIREIGPNPGDGKRAAVANTDDPNRARAKSAQPPAAAEPAGKEPPSPRKDKPITEPASQAKPQSVKRMPDEAKSQSKARVKSVAKEAMAEYAAKLPVPTEPIKPKGRGGNSAPFNHIVAIGTSTGGPRALHEVITSLPGDFPAPVLVVQHMPPKFTKSLAQRLDSFSELQVVEAQQGERVSAGVVYIAPGGYHLELAKDSSGYSILLTDQPQRNGHRPSVDVLFESLIGFKELKRHAVVMTGMGSDGAKGMKKLSEAGIETSIAEAEETCVVYGMPRSAVEAGCVDKILPLQHIAAQLVHAVLK
ncbi:protein-glutamate methylesterase/protein-glutamine glutaminase [Paenibacillus arenilitoris]|uniref:Protein-glutamate methylesterase/protein-glutamine glutaminase n=1 Tax=Paenibacillus arenilitoris TaxID=2772299 RepID=A0A927CMF6_9BACL|nr:chemotaxis response regulator protein-glutamate methylesterase [Paenibacillus arenilitoris]MBD2870719.1 chemotaxis response regulator protein-glutamate methylesterase [Paenibacillus arenilitoris]